MRESFMKERLVRDDRFRFCGALMALAAAHGATATLVVVDTDCRFACKRAASFEDDLAALFSSAHASS